MADVQLDNVASGFNLTKINSNFTKLATAINDEILHRSGGNNTMLQQLDANSNRIINVGAPTSSSDAVRKLDLDNAVLGVGEVGVVPLVQPRQLGDNSTVIFDTPADSIEQAESFLVNIDELTKRPNTDYSINAAGDIVFTFTPALNAKIDVTFFKPQVLVVNPLTDLSLNPVLAIGSTTPRTLGNRAADVINIEDCGAAAGNTEAENKTALQKAIDALNGKAGLIYVPSDIDYGWIRLDKSTWPDFSNVEDIDTRIVIDDYSLGDTGVSGRSGAQRRTWYYTGLQEDGQHNGNFEYVKAGWHPGLYISNDGDPAKMIASGGLNRRASIFFATDGESNWRVGQGRITDNSATEPELAGFVIAANGLPDLGIVGLTSMMTINKTDGNIGFNKGIATAAFDIVGRLGAPSGNRMRFTAPQTSGLDPILDLTGDTQDLLLTATSDGFKFQDGVGTLLDVKTQGRVWTHRGRGGNVQLDIETDSYKRTLLVRNDNGSLNVTNLAGSANIVTITDTEIETDLIHRPKTDGTIDIGTVSRRFNDVYAVGTITPSDANLKTEVTPISDAECLAALEMELVKFKFNDAVALKGTDARFHYGVIAQDAMAIFTQHGIDVNQFSPICISERTNPETGESEGEIWQVRYTELSVIVMEALKRKALGLI